MVTAKPSSIPPLPSTKPHLYGDFSQGAAALHNLVSAVRDALNFFAGCDAFQIGMQGLCCLITL